MEEFKIVKVMPYDNKTYIVVQDTTKDEYQYWYLEISSYEFNQYAKKHKLNQGYTKENAYAYINDINNDTEGTSVGSFNTLTECLDDIMCLVEDRYDY